MAQLIFRRVEEQADALRNAELIPYENSLDDALVEDALAEEKIGFRIRIYTPLATLWTSFTQLATLRTRVATRCRV